MIRVLLFESFLLQLRCLVVLQSLRLVNVNEDVMQQVDRGQDDFTLIELSDVLDRVIVKVAFNSLDLIVEHESVNEKRTDLIKEDTLLTAFSCYQCKTAVEFSLGILGLRVSVNLIDEEDERIDVILLDNEVADEVDDHAADTFCRTE